MTASLLVWFAIATGAPELPTAEVEEVFNFATAAREANQNPKDIKRQQKAARLAFALFQKAKHSNKPRLANSISRFGSRIVLEKPELAEGHMWKAIGIGYVAWLQGTLGNQATVRNYLASAERSLKRDPNCMGGLVQVHMGLMYLVAPAGSELSMPTKGLRILADAQRLETKSPQVSLLLAEAKSAAGNFESLQASTKLSGGSQ